MSELSVLRARYKELSGKNASPSMKADALQAKIAELEAAAAHRTRPRKIRPSCMQDPPDAPAPMRRCPMRQPLTPGGAGADVADAPEQSVEDACAELGLAIEADGHCPVEMLESVSGGMNLKPRRSAPVRSGRGRPRGPRRHRQAARLIQCPELAPSVRHQP
jgi:hypothetical protein